MTFQCDMLLILLTKRGDGYDVYQVTPAGKTAPVGTNGGTGIFLAPTTIGDS